MDAPKTNSIWTPPTWGERTFLMGILNVTPDSFSDGGQYAATIDAVGQEIGRAHV